MAGFDATSRSFLKLWPILLVAGIVAVTLALTSSAQAAGREPGAPAFDSSGYLHVEYGCDYFAAKLAAYELSPYLGPWGGVRSSRTQFYQRYGPTLLMCQARVETNNGPLGCTVTYVVGGVDYAISGWKRTNVQCG